jgi:hypothetical protein
MAAFVSISRLASEAGLKIHATDAELASLFCFASDQLVTLTTTTPHTKVRIVGITPDYGLLRTIPVREGLRADENEYIDLQPDGNSFDMMEGLIKTKT